MPVSPIANINTTIISAMIMIIINETTQQRLTQFRLSFTSSPSPILSPLLPIRLSQQFLIFLTQLYPLNIVFGL